MLTEQPTEADKPDDLTETGQPSSHRIATFADTPAQQSKSTTPSNTTVPLGVKTSTPLSARDDPATAGADDDSNAVSLVDTDSVLESDGSHRSRSRQGSIDSITSAELKSWLWKRGQNGRAAVTDGGNESKMQAIEPHPEGPASVRTSTRISPNSPNPSCLRIDTS